MLFYLILSYLRGNVIKASRNIGISGASEGSGEGRVRGSVDPLQFEADVRNCTRFYENQHIMLHDKT